MKAYLFDWSTVKKVPHSKLEAELKKANRLGRDIWIQHRDSNFMSKVRWFRVLESGAVRVSVGAGGVFVTRWRDALKERVNAFSKQDDVYVAKK